jgi:HNH endonuclease
MKLCECGCGLPTKIADRTRGSRGWVKGEPHRFLHGHNAKGGGTQHNRWRGGRTVREGYVLLTVAPYVQIHEHRFVMERHLGRALSSEEVVHHIDGDKANNALENLEVLSRAAHTRLHFTK